MKILDICIANFNKHVKDMLMIFSTYLLWIYGTMCQVVEIVITVYFCVVILNMIWFNSALYKVATLECEETPHVDTCLYRARVVWVLFYNVYLGKSKGDRQSVFYFKEFSRLYLKA